MPFVFVRCRLISLTVLLPFLSLRASEVVIYGATPGGIAAAVSSAKGGREVLLLEPTDQIGGLLTSGLSHTDFRSFESLTGFFWDFSKRVEKHYATTYGPDSPQLKDCFRGTHGEPRVNLLILKSMLEEFPKISLKTNERLLSVKTSPPALGRQRILSLTTTASTHTGKVFIDASYEGDLMALAGENYHIGRESRAQYGEAQAGDELGHADGQLQGYNYRFIMTQVEENKVPAPKPKGYRREDFTGVLPHFTSGKLTKVFSAKHDGIYRAHLPLMPNGKADVNDTPHAPVRLSMPDINDNYPEANHATRLHIIEQHYYYNVGLLYFLQNDPEVPAEIQADARSWGFCRDEFQSSNHIPPALYIREARRLVGQHVLTGNDTAQAPGDARAVLHRDSIAISDYVHNCHGTGRKGTRYQGSHSGEFYKPVPPFQIPYGTIVPAKNENLLVPVACSASHFGFGAIRLEPVWSSLGQAAGWAAHLSLESNQSIQALSVPKLQSLLHHDRSATIYLSDIAPDSLHFAAAQWLGTQGGFHGLHSEKQPKAKRIVSQYNEAFPGHAAELDQNLDQPLLSKWNSLLPPDRRITTAKNKADWLNQAHQP